MQDLYIVGAGGLGREIVCLLEEIQRITGQQWNVKGFLDDTENPLKGRECSLGVVGSIQDYTPAANDVLVMGIAAPEAKMKLVPMLKSRGTKFASIIHPYAYLGRFNRIGEGVVIYGGFSMSVNCTIGNFTTLLSSYVGHDCVIGDYCTVSAQCDLMGHTTLGGGVFMGGNVAVAPGVQIGAGAYICVGSVLIKDVSPGAKMLGNPAREIGFNDACVEPVSVHPQMKHCSRS